ncbi:hypothetical protein PYCC9005_001157 [Savitreella phatthalungensis]
MTSTWQPQQDVLGQFRSVLQASMSADAQARTSALEQIDIAKSSVPDCNNYLAYIFLQPGATETSIRSAAGLLLKNNVRFEYPTISPDSLAYVQEASFQGLRDDEHLIRSIAGNIITSIIYRGGVRSWPDALPYLMQLLDDADDRLVDGAIGALSKICEDSAKELDNDFDGTRPLNFMIPKFLALTESPKEKLRSEALFCINQFILMKSQSLFAHIDAFLTRLFALATDSSTNVRKNVCQALVMLLDVRPDKIAPNLGSIVEYMLYSTQDEDEQVALEACEFWLAIAEQPDLQGSLEPYLSKIVPMLLKGMVYSEMDLLALGADEDDAHVADKAEDIRPQHAKAKQHVVTEQTSNEASRKINGLHYDDATADDEDDDEDYDDDEEEDDLYAEWNLRKCSAAALDVLSTVYGTTLLEQCLPHLQATLQSADWKEREAGVLALGAIAEGCLDGMSTYLPDIFPPLLNFLKDQKPLIRQITCWTLGRYGTWVCNTEHFPPLLEGLLGTMLDNNKRVQEAGCSAFANLEDCAQQLLVPYLPHILRHIVAAFDKYQQKNLLILYDAVQTLADAVGPELSKQEYIDVLMPPLLQRWSSIPDDDRDLFPLLECLSSVTVALGGGFAPFAEPVFGRSIAILRHNLSQVDAFANGTSADAPEKDFLITAVDLLSGMVQGLGASIRPLIAQAQPPLMQLLQLCMADPIGEVRQSAYALLGDLVMNCWQDVEPYLTQVMSELVQQIDTKTDSVSVANNATWSAGEICLQAGAGIEPWAEVLLDRLVAVMRTPKVQSALLENAAITFGRMGLTSTERTARRLDVAGRQLCHALQDSVPNREKDSAFRGLCQTIAANPNALAAFFPDFVLAVAKYGEPSPELHDMFAKILQGFKPVYPDWERLMANLEPSARQVMAQTYQV